MLRPNDIIGPYKLTRRLGSGAFGEVWLAEKHAAIVSPEVAIKFALSDDIDFEAVKREAEVWKLASGHPNVIPIIEANVYDGHLVIVSEYARDGSLNNWLKRHNGRAPSISAAIEVMMGILAGLEHLHAQRIVHRDLKPDNILLQGATPRLADFGISRVITSKYSEHAVGTLPYQAPETFKGRYIEQTDLWSAGVIFYQLLAGRRPFRQPDEAPLIHAILNDPPDPLPADVPAQLQEVIARALQKDAAQRYQTAAEMRETLRQASKSIFDRQTVKIDPQPAEPPGANSPDQPINPSDITQPRSNRWKYAAAGVVMALAIGLVMFLNRNSSAPAKASSETKSLSLAPTAKSTVADSPTPPASQTEADIFKERLLVTVPKEYEKRSTASSWLPAFSRDGSKVVYAASRGGKDFVVFGDMKGPEFDSVGEPVISSDGSKIAYSGIQNGKEFVIVGGKKITEFDVSYHPIFSPDGGKLAYIAWQDGKRFIVVNNQKGPAFDSVGTPVFSHDGSRIAYSAKIGKKSFVMIGDKKGPEFDSVDGLVFSHDGKRVAYAAQQGNKYFVVIDGQKGQGFSYVRDPIFSSDGNKVAYSARDDTISKWLIVVDGVKGREFDGAVVAPVFSPDGSKVACQVYFPRYMGESGPHFIAVGDKEWPRFDFMDIFKRPVFSPDGTKVAYAAHSNDTKWFVVVNDKKGLEVDWVWNIVFSSDGSKVAYGAEQGREIWWKVMDAR